MSDAGATDEPSGDLDAGMRPPFGFMPGPNVSDAEVVVQFATTFASAGACVHSNRFYVEGPLLIADGDQTVAMRVAPAVVLVRTDVPDDIQDDRHRVEHLLSEAGLAMLDEETLWGVPIALQLAGLRISIWDLWGNDLDFAFAAVRTVAIGDESADFL